MLQLLQTWRCPPAHSAQRRCRHLELAVQFWQCALKNRKKRVIYHPSLKQTTRCKCNTLTVYLPSCVPVLVQEAATAVAGKAGLRLCTLHAQQSAPIAAPTTARDAMCLQAATGSMLFRRCCFHDMPGTLCLTHLNMSASPSRE